MRSPNNAALREIASSLETTPETLAFLPELVAGIDVLGSWPEVIVDMLRSASLPPSARALDVGCGKGGVAVPLARELGFQVAGIDLFEPFLEEARERAARAGVADRCEFALGDMRSALEEGGDFDVVVYAALGGLLGPFDRCVGRLRRAVRPGGYIVVDDGFLAPGARVDRSGYEHYAAHSATVERLTAHGDRLVNEALIPGEEVAAYNERNNRLIARHATELACGCPEAARILDEYVENQLEECRVLEGRIWAAIWLLQRPAG